MISIKQRISLWDNCKFFLIISVVIGHYCEAYLASRALHQLFLFIYGFHMPMFIYISGLFSKEERDLRNAVLYFLYGLSMRVFLIICWIILKQPVSFKIYIEPNIAWFMYALAVFSVIGHLVRKTKIQVVLFISVIIACVVGYFQWNTDFLVSARIVAFFPFYLLGIMTPKDFWPKLKVKACLKALAFVIGVLWAGGCYFFFDHLLILRPLFTGRHFYSSEMGIWGAGYRLIAYAITILVGAAIIIMMPAKRMPDITKLGSRSLQVYFWHLIILKPLNMLQVNSWLCSKAFFGKCVWLLIGLCSTFFLFFEPFKYPLALVKKLISNHSIREFRESLD